MKKILFVMMCAVVVLTTVNGRADVVGYLEGGTLTNGAMGTAGTGPVAFDFTVNTSINVTQLGFYGDTLNGDTPWTALYDVTKNTQLAAVTNFGATYGNFSGWEYTALGSPVTLTPGDTYQIAATAYWSPQYANSSGFTFGSAINSLGFTVGTGWGGWGTPAENMGAASPGNAANIEGNFKYALAVPEPSTYALFGIGGFALFFMRRKKAFATA